MDDEYNHPAVYNHKCLGSNFPPACSLGDVNVNVDADVNVNVAVNVDAQAATSLQLAAWAMAQLQSSVHTLYRCHLSC